VSVGTSTEPNFSTYRIVNSDQSINSDNCYKETVQNLQSSGPHPHTSTVENDPLHNGIYNSYSYPNYIVKLIRHLRLERFFEFFKLYFDF